MPRVSGRFLASPDLRLIIFGGKGGSGKTTSAAATALYLTERDPGKRTLVVSTDPAHSLGDCLGMSIGKESTRIAEGLWGLEIDAGELLEDYKERHGGTLRTIAERGTYFDAEDIESFLSQSLPGMDEVMAVIHVAGLLRAGEFDRVVLDTAPTGHTLVLLALPQEMERWIDLFDMLMEKHRYLMKTMVGRYRRDECDEFIDNQRNDIRRLGRLLTDPKATEFVPVMWPDPMSISETQRAVSMLQARGIAVRSIVVNQVVSGSNCALCKARCGAQQELLSQIEQMFASYDLVKVPLFPHQIKEQALADFGRVLFGVGEPPGIDTATTERSDNLLRAGSLQDLASGNPRFVIFGGKGGVGKTTIAAASALYLAERRPEERVLVFSTDPAHALSDVYRLRIGNRITRVAPLSNLDALEVDGAQMLEDLKREYQADIDEAFDRFLGGRGLDIKFDREVLRDLVSLSPPGLDELMALQRIMQLMQQGEYGLTILDSAASGHLIRFLETPQLVRDWLKVVFRLLMKYRNLVKMGRATQLLLDLSSDTRKVLELFASPEDTEFVVITLAEDMAVAETDDLVRATARLGIPSSHLVVNMVLPSTDCPFCAAKAAEQQQFLCQIRERMPNHVVVELPLLTGDIRGVDNLLQVAHILYGESVDA